MKFVSTRRHDGSGERELYSFEEALLSGYAPDGGLFVPSKIPSINERLQVLSEMSYPQLAYEILVRPKVPGAVLVLTNNQPNVAHVHIF